MRLDWSGIRHVVLTASIAYCALSTPSQAQSISGDVAGFYEDALVRFENGDSVGAALQLKNVLQAQADHRAARILLGRIYLKEGAAEAAEEQFLQARALGADESLLVLPLAEAFLRQHKYDDVITKILYSGYRPSIDYRLKTFQGTAYTELGQYDRAMGAFAEAAKLVPHAPEPIAGQAIVLLRRGQLPDALAKAELAAAQGPESAEAWNALGSVHHALGELEQAHAHYAKVLEYNESHVEARIARAGVALDLNKLDSAAQDLAYLRTHYSLEPRSAFLQSVLLTRQGDEKGAKAAVSEAVQLLANLSPAQQAQESSLLLMGGIANFNLNAHEQAEKFLTRYLDKRPNDSGARRLLASIYLKKGWNDDVVGLLNPLLQQPKRDPRVLGMLATAFSRQGRSEQATPLLEEAVTLDGGTATSLHQLALNYIDQRKHEDALTRLEELTSKHPSDMAGHVTLTTLRLAQRKYPEAIDAATTALAIEPGHANLRNLLGVALTKAGDLDKAEQTFEDLAAQDPSYVPARINLAKVAIARGDYTLATKRFEEALTRFPEHVTTLLEFTKHLAKLPDYDTAIRTVEKALTVEAKSIRANVMLVELLLAAEQADRALAAAKAAESWAPENGDILTILARSYLATNNNVLAIVSLRNGATNAGYNVSSLLQIATLQAEANAWEDADWSLQKVLAQNPDNLQAKVKLVEAQLMLMRFDQGLELAEEIKRDFPKRAAGEGLIGEILVAQENYAAASERFAAALAIEPSDLGAVRYYEATGQAGQANAGEWLELWVKSHPEHHRARQALAEHFMATNKLASAQREYETLLNGAFPNHARLWNNLANVLHAQNAPGALDAAQRAKALAPDDPFVNDTLGWLLIQKGDVRDGLALLRAAQTRAAESPEIHYHIGVALHQLDRNSAAIRSLEYAISAKRNFPGLADAKTLLAKIRP